MYIFTMFRVLKVRWVISELTRKIINWKDLLRRPQEYSFNYNKPQPKLLK